MIPIKDPTGGAAAVPHNQTERTPDKYADQIANIENNGNHEQPDFANYPGVIQYSDYYKQATPQNKDFICRFCGGYHIASQCLVVNFIFNGTKTVCKQLL